MAAGTYIAAWPSVRVMAGGVRTVVARGEALPDGVDQRVVSELALCGAVVAGSPVAAAVVDQLDGPPAKSAKVSDWRAYAVDAVGLDETEMAALKKPEVIAAVEAALEVGSDGDDQDGSDAEGDEDESAGDAGVADPDAPTIT